ncbi:MAG: hypothetical protein QOJ69_660 [Actinomycetota bacterium]|nr:hypothetical protein [Actinomycetota bacterium]
MNARRGLLCGLVLGLAVAAFNPLTASAQLATHRQSVASPGWAAPWPAYPEHPFGIGQWVYVAPIPPAGPAQLPTTGYVYGLSFVTEGASGVIGLSSDAEGPIAGIKMAASSPNPSLATIRYDWSPGKFYFLLAYHLGNGLWAGWVYDNAASAWTPIGAVQSPTAGHLSLLSVNTLYGARGAPTTGFAQDGADTEQPCRAFPRVDAYFYPPVHFWQSTFALSTMGGGFGFGSGDCLTEATREFDWVHVRLGSPAGAAG